MSDLHNKLTFILCMPFYVVVFLDFGTYAFDT
jgi:hypothetical protein